MRAGSQSHPGSRSEPESIIRCAIYTRKSTDEGLEQEFNSLDAQRESAEAYIESQKHEGWVCLPDHYDDGGFSGGSMERPALKRLLSDIESGKVGCIVVYKVDRLSRSLLDFARIMELLDQRHVSFVSVTQQFNTTNSMGRLTLNILLSFAQFEREIIAERTRDKMSAARRKGKWIGGMPVLGYDVDPGAKKLIVNENEAARVREIYEIYLEQRSLLAAVRELKRRGWTTKRWITKKGHEHGGRAFNKNNLFSLLTSVTYIGKVKYKGTIYEGEHEAIVDDGTWRKVQDVLRRNGKNGGKDVRNKHGALLKGLLYCVPCGNAMYHTYTLKNNKRYYYYVCTRAQKEGWDACPTKSLPAAEIERFVIDQIRCIGDDGDFVNKVVNQARRQNQKRIKDLKREYRTLEGESKQYNAEVRKIIGTLAEEDVADTARLADLQDRIRTIEKQATTMREEIIALSRETVSEQELAACLSLFDPVWESLSRLEQARILRLLFERIGYDGEKEAVSVTFRPNGIKTLGQEVDIRDSEVPE